MSDQNPPAPAPGPEGQAPGESPPPTPSPAEESAKADPGKPSRGRLAAIFAATLVIVLVVAGTGAYFLFLRSDAKKIVTPTSAGSMKRDKAKETSLKTQLQQAEAQFKQQGQTAGCSLKVAYTRSAVYGQNSTKRGPKGGLVFLGAKLTTDDKKPFKPATWTDKCFGALAKQNGLTVTKTNVGENANALCAQVASPQKVAICVWATKDTVGELVPTVPGWDAKQLGAIMRDLRPDVEQPE